jgi:hypothetical protein
MPLENNDIPCSNTFLAVVENLKNADKAQKILIPEGVGGGAGFDTEFSHFAESTKTKMAKRFSS